MVLKSSAWSAATSTSGKTKRRDVRRIVCCASFQIIPDIPDGAIIARVHRSLSVILPPQRIRLARFPHGDDAFMNGETSAWIGGESAGETLAGEVSGAAIRISDPDIPASVRRRARHPTECAVWRIGPLLVQGDVAATIEAQLVPSHATSACARVDGVYSDDRLVPVDSPIDHACHQFVSLGIETLVGSRLRHALRELAAAQILIGRDGDLVR